MDVGETMTRRLVSVVTLGLGVLAMATASVQAGQRRPVPDIQMPGRDGRNASLRASLPAQPSIVIFVAPGSAPSELLLEAMATWTPAIDLTRLVFVVDGRSPDAGQWLARYLPPNGEGVPLVFFDVDGKGRTALAISGAPALLGIAAGEIRWDLVGVLNDPSALEPMIRNWTTRR
jgi:hypothetical protein